MSNSHSKISVRTQILVPSIGALLVFAFVMGWFLIATTNKTFNTKFAQTGQALVDNTAPTMSFALATGDRDNLKTRLQSLFRQNELRHIEVITSAGTFSVALSRQDSGLVIEVFPEAGQKVLFKPQPNHETFHADVSIDPIEVDFISGVSPHKQQPVGTLRAILDRSSIIKERNDVIFKGILITLFTAMLMCVIVAALARRIVQPLQNLTSTLEILEGGDFSARAGNSTIDEVGRVQAGVNTLAASLGEAKHDLEQKVEQATAKLVESVDELERSEGKYRNLVDSASDGVFSLNSNLRLTQINPAMEKLTGRDRDELIGKHLVNLVVPEQRDQVTRRYSTQVTGRSTATFELGLATATGETVILEISSRPQFNDENCVGFHGVARDVTARQRVEQERAEAQQVAEAANRAKSMFLATVSHEIRSPMNGILGFLNLLNKTQPSPLQLEYITTADKSAKTLMRIIDDLLDIARIESGYPEFRPEPVELVGFIEHVMAETRQQVDAENLILKTELDPELPSMVVTDPARLNQILTNILGNSCKFTEEGEVVLNVDCVEKVDASAIITFSVRDSGPGFAEDDIDELLKPFERGPEAIENKVAGVGLGLAVTKTLLDEMEGRIDISNLPNGGGEVKITVTLRTRSDSVVSSQNPESDSNRKPLVDGIKPRAVSGKLKVLVVDDSQINTRFVSTVLDYHGIETVEASSGLKAAEICESSSFDLIFTDLHMPVMDGVETAQRIRKILAGDCPPVVVLTADATVKSNERLLREDFTEILYKPVAESQLLSVITQLTGYTPLQQPSQNVSAATDRGSDNDVLNRNHGIALAGGNEELWESNMVLFIKDLQTVLPLFDPSRPNFDTDDLGEQTHRLSGSAAYIGARNIENLAMNVEIACQNSQTREIERVCSQFMKAADEFFTQARQAGLMSDDSVVPDNVSKLVFPDRA